MFSPSTFAALLYLVLRKYIANVVDSSPIFSLAPLPTLEGPGEGAQNTFPDNTFHPHPWPGTGIDRAC